MTLKDTIALVTGGHMTVQGAVGLAQRLGVSEDVIGLTVIAIGTSLPELAASLVAVGRGHVDIALGNVVGSNILNLLLVGGLCAAITPIPAIAIGSRTPAGRSYFVAAEVSAPEPATTSSASTHSSTIRCALVPPKPNALTAARRWPSQGVRSVRVVR